MSPDTRTIRLEGLPLQVWAQSKEHVDGLLREFALISGGRDSGDDDTPARLLALVDALRQRFGAGTAERDARLFAALDAGHSTIDEELELPLAALEATRSLGGLLDEADEYCRQGKHLLTLATAPELVAFRRWYLDEIAAQLQGGAPTPWPGTAA